MEDFLRFNKATISPRDFACLLLSAAVNSDTVVFVPWKQINGPSWPEDVMKVFAKNYRREHGQYFALGKRIEDDYLAIPMIDKVLSGFSIMTTDYNTISNLIDSFVVMRKMGIKEPWLEY